MCLKSPLQVWGTVECKDGVRTSEIDISKAFVKDCDASLDFALGYNDDLLQHCYEI